MHANVITYPLPSDKLERVVAGIRAGSREMASIPGFRDAHFMYSHERAEMMLVIVFETAAQLDAAWQHAQPEVAGNVAALGSTLTVHTYEVMHDV